MRSLVFPALLGCSVVLMLAMLLAVFELPAQPARARLGDGSAGRVLLTASVSGTDTLLASPSQSLQRYGRGEIFLDHEFMEMISEDEKGLCLDLERLQLAADRLALLDRRDLDFADHPWVPPAVSGRRERRATFVLAAERHD